MQVDVRMANLDRANRIRSYRSEVKRNLRAGAPVCPMLEDPPAELLSMRVEQLLLALPKWGQGRVRPLMRRLAIPPHVTVGGLTWRQRADLPAALEEAGFC